MNPVAGRFAALMGSASFLALINVLPAAAQQTAQAQTAQATASDAVPEQVLVTGSLIHGAAAVGVPVTNLSPQDFTETGSVTIGELFRTIPAANVQPEAGQVQTGGHQVRETRVNIRGLDGKGLRSLLMVDGVRYSPQEQAFCALDPSIVPSLALDRVDILVDGASATYGSDAIGGVVNLVLKRGYDGAITQLHTQYGEWSGLEVQASQLIGHTWDGGDVTVTFEYINQAPVTKSESKYTLDFRPWGLDSEIPIGSSLPGVVSTGAPSVKNGQGISGVGTVCANCFSIPAGTGANFSPINGGVGPTAPGSAAFLTWAQLLTHPGVTNEIDPLQQGWSISAQQKNSFVATFDQRLYPGISFFFTGLYSDRRVQTLTPRRYITASSDIFTWAVPTINPYYPTGAPAGLQVSYDLGLEYAPRQTAYETAQRYQVGFNLDLPFGWNGQIYDSLSYERSGFTAFGVNQAAVSIALGNTVSGVSKPASVPYLNVFCDPTAFQCNDLQTIQFIGGESFNNTSYRIEEQGARFDGPLFDLPGGQIKAAVGGTHEWDKVQGSTYNNTTATIIPLSVPPGITGLRDQIPADLATTSPVITTSPFSVWAVFAQVDIPLFGDNFSLPLVKKFDFEVSWRHDQYDSATGELKGGTSNPKLAFNWLVDDMVGATVRGSWGTSFRLANPAEFSNAFFDTNSPEGIAGRSGFSLTCLNGQPTAGSLNAALFAAGFACGSQPGGIVWGGAPHAALRGYVDASTGLPASREGGTSLPPERAKNYSIGLELAPQFDFLKGLDLQATWYSIKIDGSLTAGGAASLSTLSDPTQRFRFIVPSDLGCPVAANAHPTTCAPFEAMAVAALSDRGSTVSPSFASSIFWIQDGSTSATGFLHLEGLDWTASYAQDFGDLGVWNAGITGTYYLHRYSQALTGGPVVDLLHQNITPVGGVAQNGVETAPRMIYRARLGWSDGAFSVTGFMNYTSHSYSPLGSPPNVNFQCTSAGGTVGGGTFPCAISNFTNYVPNFITFDLSFGYNTGDMPANDYLKNLTVQFTVQNLFNRFSPFVYNPTAIAGNIPGAYDNTKSMIGRTFGLTLIKNW